MVFLVCFTDVRGESTVCFAESCSRQTLCETIMSVTTTLHLLQFPEENCKNVLTREAGVHMCRWHIFGAVKLNKTTSEKLNNTYCFCKVNSKRQLL